MRTVLTALLAISVCSSAVPAQATPPQTATTRSFARAREVLHAAAEAHGGLEKLRSVKTVHRTGKGKIYTQGQNLGPDAPPSARDLETDVWIDFPGTRARVENRTRLAGNPIHTRNVLAGDSGYAWNAATNASTRFTPTGGAGLRNTIRRDPLRVIVNALGRAETARSLGTDTHDARPHDVVSYAESDGTVITLFLDANTHLLGKVETWADAAVLGDTLTEQIYSDYRTVDGIKAPFRLTVRSAGQVTQEMSFSAIEPNATPEAAAFDLPANLLEQAPAATATVEVTPLGPGVHLIGGGTHASLAVEFADHVVVVDAPLSGERTRTVLDEVKKLAPGKPVRSVVNTHYHFDHTGGLREYIAEGVTVLTHAANAGFVKGLATRPRGIRPDRLTGKPTDARLRTVTDKLVLSDATQTLELHALPNSHARGMLVAFVPKLKVLYNADLFGPPLVGPLPIGNDFTFELREGIRKLGLQVETLAPAHGRIATMADLEESIRKRPTSSK